MQYLIAFCSQLETASHAISGKFVGPNVPDKRIKFSDPRLNCSREIIPKTVGGGIFDDFFAMISNQMLLVTSYPSSVLLKLEIPIHTL